MRKTAIIIAILFPNAAFAAMPVLGPSIRTEPPEQSQNASAIGTHSAQTSDQLSMGPDPGGKTGATVTPATTKTGQPSSEAATGTSNQSGANGTAVQDAASSRTDSSASPSGSETLKQQRPSSGTTGTGPTPSSTSTQPGTGR